MASPRAWTLTWIGTIVGAVGTLLLIVWDSGKHVVLWANLTGNEVGDWPEKLNWMRSARALQNDINWPESWTQRSAGLEVAAQRPAGAAGGGLWT